MIKRAKKGWTYELKTSCGPLYVTCNDKNNRLAQVFIKLGKSGGCSAAHMRAYGILTSKLLARDMGADLVIKALKGIGCHVSDCCVDAVARAIEMHEGRRADGTLDADAVD